MRECDAKFDPSSVSGLDLSVKTVCSAVREYKACLAELIRVHGCGDTPLLVSRQQRINEFLREQRICVEHVNGQASSPCLA
ncbi:hypothetical protein HPB50_029174 [Hyalomma asiaticum]|nr:hypothetical protein HPB50_029174 [Hyalomma asiaticum]